VTDYNVDGYVELLRAIFTPERGKWRYRCTPRKRTRDSRHLAIRMVCEHWIHAARAWEQAETWVDWYKRSPRGALLYQGHRYQLIRTLDPWHESTRETTTWPEELMARRRRDTAFLHEMITIRGADAPPCRIVSYD